MNSSASSIEAPKVGSPKDAASIPQTGTGFRTLIRKIRNFLPDADDDNTAYVWTRVLIQDTRAGLFYQGRGRWTQDDRRALDFQDVDIAREYLSRCPQGQAEIIIRSLNGQEDLRVSV